MDIRSILMGGSKSKKVGTLTPEQEQLLGSWSKFSSGVQDLEQNPLYMAAIGQIMNILGGDDQSFAEPYMRKFQQEIVPGIAERFTATGSGRRSSAFNRSITSAGADLTSMLSEVRSRALNDALSQALQFSVQPNEQRIRAGSAALGTKAFENVMTQSQGILPAVAGAAAGGLGQFGGSLAGLELAKRYGLLPKG